MICIIVYQSIVLLNLYKIQHLQIKYRKNSNRQEQGNKTPKTDKKHTDGNCITYCMSHFKSDMMLNFATHHWQFRTLPLPKQWLDTAHYNALAIFYHFHLNSVLLSSVGVSVCLVFFLRFVVVLLLLSFSVFIQFWCSACVCVIFLWLQNIHTALSLSSCALVACLFVA